MADQQSPMSGAFSNPYVDTVAAQVNEDFVTSQNERRKKAPSEESSWRNSNFVPLFKNEVFHENLKIAEGFARGNFEV